MAEAKLISAAPTTGAKPKERTALGGVMVYVVALAVTVAALLIRWWATPWIGLSVPYATVFGAVAIAVWLGGWRPALLAAIVGYFGASLWFTEPVGRLSLLGTTELINGASCWLSWGVIIGLGEAMRGARSRAESNYTRMLRAADELREAEEQLRLHREKLEKLVEERTAALEESHRQLSLAERMAALGTLSAGLGHDMGNILVPMRLSLGDLERMELPAGGRENIQVLWRSIDYLKSLASGLRLLSLDPEVESAVSRTTVLQTWWSETARLCGAALPRAVRMTAAGLEEAPPVAMPAHALTQIVFNLIQNAGDAVRLQGPGNIRVEARDTPSGVRLTVHDDGPGMSPEVKARCLEPFFTTKTRGRGTGLGLAIVFRLAKRYGTSVEIESEPGQGCAVTLLLPHAREPQGPVLSAAVSVRDPRAAAIARSLLSANGTQLSNGHAAPAGPGLWVVDDQVPEIDVASYVSEDARRCVVRLGSERDIGPRVLPVVEPKAGSMRDAIARALCLIRGVS